MESTTLSLSAPDIHGVVRLQHSSGELMHPLLEPFQEAMQLYVLGSHLSERILRWRDLIAAGVKTPEDALVIWDIGLGQCANASAAISAIKALYESCDSPHLWWPKIQIYSFEADLEALKLVIGNPQHFPYADIEALQSLLEVRNWKSKFVSWHLLHGDFRDLINVAPRPNVVFYDPFSQLVTPELWHYSLFSEVGSLMCEDSCLVTYSSSTAVRAAFLAAGLCVSRGASIGRRRETTVAFKGKNFGLPKELLDTAWLEKWQLSPARWPLGMHDDESDLFARLIKGHPQFCGEHRLSQRVAGE